MPKVFKRAGSSNYYYRLFMGGKERWINTEETNREKAQAKADGKSAAVKGKLTLTELVSQIMVQIATMPPEDRPRIRQEIAGVLMAGTGSALALSDAWATWLNSPLKGNPSAQTIAGYETCWKRFKTWAEGQNITQLHEVTPMLAEDYASHLWSSKVSPRTFNYHIKFLLAMFKMLRVKAGIFTNPWGDIKTMALETQGRHNFTPEELTKITSSATGSLRTLIAIGLYTGLRLGDAVALRWEDIREEVIEVIPNKTRRKGKVITIPLHPVLRMVLMQHQRTTGLTAGPLFPEESKEYARSHDKLSRGIQSFFMSCGIVTKAELAKGAHRKRRAVIKGFHSLRHSFVSLCAANNVPPSTIQALVGHGSPAMTAIYTHIDNTQKKEAIAALPAMSFTPQELEEKL